MESTMKNWLKWLKENEQTVSMVMGAVVIVALGYYLLSRNTPPTTTEQAASTETTIEGQKVELKETEAGLMAQNLPDSYTVKAGDILWAIAEKHYGSGFNWVDIAKENNLNNANAIEEGQTLKLPNVRVRVPVGVDPKTLVANSGAVSAIEPTPIVSQAPQMNISSNAEKYTVEKGDSLWNISVKMYNDGYKWMEIYNANKGVIKNPGVIEAGWELQIPKV